MIAERSVVTLVSDYRAIWQRDFPSLVKRAQWQIVRQLCSTGQAGLSLGEISGMVRQIFLLDEATVRERVNDLCRAGFCTVEGGRELSARSIVMPAPALLTRFDAHLLDLAERFAATITLPSGQPRIIVPRALDIGSRGCLIQVIDAFCGPWQAAAERVLAAGPLSPARRLEVRRHLRSPSHWALLFLATRHLITSPETGAHACLVADRMAADLIDFTGQNFQTTRDHIVSLIEAGLLLRCPGKSLQVTLSETAAKAFVAAIQQTASLWQGLAPGMAIAFGVAGGRDPTAAMATESDAEATMKKRPASVDPSLAGHLLRIVAPAAEQRCLEIVALPLTIGRAPTSGLMLPSSDVSRAHCRIERVNGEICVTDLGSTNGSLLDGEEITGTRKLPPGSELVIGAFVIRYEVSPPGRGKVFSL